jgi:CRISPR-associated protein Cas1
LRKLLNTLYVTSTDAEIRKDGENVVVRVDGAERGRVPLHLLGSIVAFGAVWASPALMEACARGGVTFVFLDRNGRFQARVEGPVSGNVLLRRAQYRASDNAAEIVAGIVIGKVANQRAVLLRSLRDHGDGAAIEDRVAIEAAAARLADILRRLSRPDPTVVAMRGLEGEASHAYFSVFDRLVRSPDDGIHFHGRSRRPPLDPVNALLSFFYTLLVHDCRAALESVGLDSAVGFLHRDRPGRPSLALDLMEELRPIFADRLALSLLNRRQLRARDFRCIDGGAVLLTDDARKLVLTAWQERKRTERQHPFFGEKAPLGLVPYLQAQLLARHLRQDLDAYPSWIWK